MTRPAISIHRNESWTFGSPSVLMMFTTRSGTLDAELAAMNECMPHYYRITQGHGQGARLLMNAEATFMREIFRCTDSATDRLIPPLHQTDSCLRSAVISLLEAFPFSGGVTFVKNPEVKRKELLSLHNMMWLNIFDSTYAYYYALIRMKNSALFKDHMLSTVSFLSPADLIKMIRIRSFFHRKCTQKL